MYLPIICCVDSMHLCGIVDPCPLLAEIYPEPGPAPVLGSRVLAEDLAPVPVEMIIHFLHFRGEINQATSISINKLGDFF